MTGPAPALLLAVAIDGAAALEHASRLAALGPHPFGSPRTGLAAEYVAAELRGAGLGEVRLQPFESGGRRGANVIGVLRGADPELVVLGAHHDSPPDSPGAWTAGGVGVLIETARALVAAHARPRTLVFVSWDGGEAEGAERGAGARRYVESLRAEARRVAAALALAGGGRPGRTPALHLAGAEDPLRPGRARFAPAWLVGVLTRSDPRLALGAPRLSWVYQPTVRVARPRRPLGDAAFLSAGLAAAAVWDATPWSADPRLGTPADTADALDARALAALGEAVATAVSDLAAAHRGDDAEGRWLALGGLVVSGELLLALGVLSLVPGLVAALGWGGPLLLLRLAHAALFTLLLWRHAAAACWLLVLPNLLVALPRRRWIAAAALAPLIATAAGLALAASRGSGPGDGFFAGSWLLPWELALGGAVLLASLLRPPAKRRSRRRR